MQVLARSILALGMTAVMSFPLFAAGSYGAEEAPEKPVVTGVDVEYLGDAVSDLKDAVASPAFTDNDVHAKAASLFGRIPSANTTATGPITLRGWAKPKIHTRAFKVKEGQEDISIDGMSLSVYNTLMAQDVPPPSEIMDAYLHGQQMRSKGLKNYDDEKRLRAGVLGVYMYKGVEAVGIYFHKMMRTVQAWVGNEFAAATDVHETAHARDHDKGHLNPIEVRKGEVLAYKTEYLWLKTMDPTGEKLSWARASMGKFAKSTTQAPQFVAEYLEHLAMIRDYGSRDDFYGLVAKLGYQDRKHTPFHPHGHEKSEHSDDER